MGRVQTHRGRRVAWTATIGAAVVAGLVAGPAAATTNGSAGAPDAVPEDLRDALAGVTYPRPVDLGVPAGHSDAWQVTDSGVVMGYAVTDGETQVFRWRDGTAEVLAAVEHAYPAALNEAGQVLLEGYGPGDVNHAYLWQPDGTVVDLSSDAYGAAPRGVNDHGLAAGQVYPPGTVHAVVWQDGVERRLLPDGVGSSEVALVDPVNNRGEVTGRAHTEAGSRAFVWRDGDVRYLTLPGGERSAGYGINDRGQVLVSVDEDARFLVWEPDGRVRDLDPAGTGFGARIMNDEGLAVGRMSTAAGRMLPAVADERGARRLPALGGQVGQAIGVSDNGLVVGAATRSVWGTWHATAWVAGLPVPLGETLPSSARARQSQANDVSDRGRVVGHLDVPTSDGGPRTRRAVLWDLVPQR